VIPAHGDHAALDQLLRQIADARIFDAVIVVDDASDPPLAPQPPTRRDGTGPALDLVRLPRRGGAGVARNAGMARVGTTWMLCLDADDALAPGLADLWADMGARGHLAGDATDLCLFAHADSRVTDFGGWGMPAGDARLWRAAGADAAPLATMSAAAAHLLVRTANYPWNKLMRTGFVRAAGLRCSATPVHNDIALHWHAMMRARVARVSNRVGVVHGVRGGAERLTNRTGAARLAVFGPLDAVAADIAPGSPWEAPWLRFATDLLDWIAPQMTDAGDAARFARLRRGFLARRVDAAAFARLAQADTRAALAVVRQMAA